MVELLMRLDYIREELKKRGWFFSTSSDIEALSSDIEAFVN
jgi:hypothetical protein